MFVPTHPPPPPRTHTQTRKHPHHTPLYPCHPRHPNIVWVYGIVLPNLEDRKGWKKRNQDLAELLAGVGGGSALPPIPGLLRPPALVAGGWRVGWGGGGGGGLAMSGWVDEGGGSWRGGMGGWVGEG